MFRISKYKGREKVYFNKKDYIHIVRTLGISLVGGLLFQVLHIPLPWLLGPLLIIMIANNTLKYPLKIPNSYKNIGLIYLSFVLGTSFTMETVTEVANHLPLMLTITAATVLFSVFIAIVISLFRKMNVKDAILGSIPGGLTNMVALGEEIEGTNITAVTTIQLVRLLTVITLVPLIASIVAYDSAGNLVDILHNIDNEPKVNTIIDTIIYLLVIPIFTWICIKIKMPTATIIGPILSTACLVIIGFKAPVFPKFVLDAAQLLMGAHIGLLMVLKGTRNLGTILSIAIILSISIIGFSIVIGFLMPNLMDVTPLTGLLSAAPGGVAEMGVTAAQLQANVSIVTAYQLFRLFFILLIVPFVLRFFLKKLPVGQRG